MFEQLDLKHFWAHSKYADEKYVDNPVTQEKVALVERTLGYTLPRSYIELMKSQNGGAPRKRNHRMTQPTSWAPDHVALTGIYSIGNSRPSSLCGEFATGFWIEEWGYPAIGVYFADCPSAGHDMFCLDYRDCGPNGEPTVVHVDQDFDYKITFVARDFESFICGLESDTAFQGA